MTDPADNPVLKLASWVPMVLGLLCVGAGVVVLAKPDNSLAALAKITGIFLLVDGAFEVAVSLARSTANRALPALLGVLCLIFGIALVREPIKSVTAIALLLGIWLVVMGLVRLVSAFEFGEHRGLRIVLALVELVAGIVIVSSPDIGFATLALLVGISFIMNGLTLFALGLAMHGVKRAEPGRQAGAAT